MSVINGAQTEHTNGVLSREDGNEGKPPSLDIYEANSVSEIKEALVQLHKQESNVRGRLDNLVTSQKNLARELARLDLLRAHLSSHAVTARSISNGMLSNAASTANRISGAVRQLDLEQSRVISTLDVVEQVAELKACVLGVTGSMGAPQDWETAAAYLSRASKIPDEIICGSFAEEIVPTAEVPDPPKTTLDNAAESLCGLFLREFEKSAQENNGAKVTRFFKLFPLIGKPDVGLDIYGRYVCQGVASRARANLHAGTGATQRKEGYFYANALTKLFEHVAQIVDNHGALVERHYGSGQMVKVIERLQLEADVQGGIILDTWSDERSIDRKLTDIKSYAFTFLVQSFLPPTPARSGIPRAGSPATKAATADLQAREDENLEMKGIDGFLSEIALMLGRWSLYSRFIAAKCKGSVAVTEKEPSYLTSSDLLLKSSLNRKIADRLVSPYNTLTTFFFRRSVEKAFQLDEQPLDLSLNPAKSSNSNPPYITSVVDDVMYIVNQIVERSLSTSNRMVISSVIPSVARVLGSDFIGMIQRKMRDESYPKVGTGATPPEQTVISFLVLINNLDVATDYVKRIVQSRAEGPSLPTDGGETSSPASLTALFPFNNDAVFVATTLKSLQQTFESKSAELIGDGVHVVFKNIIKPGLRPILADAFRDTDYQLSPQDLERTTREAEAEDGDSDFEAVVQRHFQQGWETLTKPIARILTDRNYERLLSTILSHLNEVLEKRIWSYYGRLNDLGAARLERDIAGIIGVAVTGGRYGLREVFARCTQICLVMNMEEDEWDELRASGNESESDFDWKIDAEERLRARAMMREVKGR